MPLPKCLDSRLRLLVFFVLLLFFPRFAEADPSIQVVQGGVAHISQTVSGKVSDLSGQFKGKKVPFFKLEEGRFVALVGIDMDQKPATLNFVASWMQDGTVRKKNTSIQVKAAKFGLQKLTLPKKKVDLDPPTLKRVRGEKKRMLGAFGGSDGQRLWRGAFIAPVKGKRQGTFGRRRLINGKPRRSHTGEDISAATGTPIVATNRGKVVLVGHFFFNGRSIVIDHGLGLMSMYFHLSEMVVKEGQMVETGDLIGKVGASGRVTGPHLHWGMRLNAARVDPYAFVGRALE